MAINFNTNFESVAAKAGLGKTVQPGQKVDFTKAISKSFENANNTQNKADASIVDLMAGKAQDINTVVASVAKADMSFKLLVGVRNKLISAYQETMKMQV